MLTSTNHAFCPGAKPKQSNRRVKKRMWLLVYVTPAIILTIIFSYLPMFGNITAFQDFDITKGFLKSPFVGFMYFKNYLKIAMRCLLLKIRWS